VPYRAAIVGAGAPVARTNANLEGFSIGKAHALAYREHPDVELAAVADIRIENARALAEENGGAQVYASLSEMLENEPALDLLSVCTWPTLHCEMVLAAIDAGVRMIICEKPMAVSLAEIDRMKEAADSAGARLFVNHQRRYAQPFRGAKRLLADGHLGDILRVEGYIGGGWDLMSWGSHWVDMARYLADDEAAWVFAAAQMSGKRRYGHSIEDRMLLQIGFSRGCLGLVHTGDHVGGAGILVTCSEGSLRLSADGAAQVAAPRSLPEHLVDDYLREVPSRHGDLGPFLDAVADVIAAYEDGRPSLIDADSGHADTEIMLAAYQSAARRAVLRLPLSDRSTDLDEARESQVRAEG
jgi:predicted dehydrogenase